LKRNFRKKSINVFSSIKPTRSTAALAYFVIGELQHMNQELFGFATPGIRFIPIIKPQEYEEQSNSVITIS